MESEVKIEEIPERAIHEDNSATYTESFAVNSPTPQEGTTAQRNLAKGVTSNKGVASDNPNKAPRRYKMLATSKLDVRGCHREGRENPLRRMERDQGRALVWNNIMYSPHTARPLISVGQLKAMLDLRLVWDDGPPMLLFCSSGIKYVLMKARVYHGLPIVSVEELKVLIDAIDDFTVTGKLWSYADWREALGRDFEVFGDSMRRDRPQTIEEEEEEEENETLHTSRKGHDVLCTSRKGPDVQDSPGKGMAIARETEIEDAECNTRRERRSEFASWNLRLRLKSMPLTRSLRTLLHLMLLLFPGKGHGVA